MAILLINISARNKTIAKIRPKLTKIEIDARSKAYVDSLVRPYGEKILKFVRKAK